MNILKYISNEKYVPLLTWVYGLEYHIGSIFDLKFDSFGRIIRWKEFDILENEDDEDFESSESEDFETEIYKYKVEYLQDKIMINNEYEIEKIKEHEYKVYKIENLERYYYRTIKYIYNDKLLDSIIIKTLNPNDYIIEFKNGKLFKEIFTDKRECLYVYHNDFQIIGKYENGNSNFKFNEFNQCVYIQQHCLDYHVEIEYKDKMNIKIKYN